jgi:hypothetical protein
MEKPASNTELFASLLSDVGTTYMELLRRKHPTRDQEAIDDRATHLLGSIADDVLTMIAHWSLGEAQRLTNGSGLDKYQAHVVDAPRRRSKGHPPKMRRSLATPLPRFPTSYSPSLMVAR